MNDNTPSVREFALFRTDTGVVAMASEHVRAIHDPRSWYGPVAPTPLAIPPVSPAASPATSPDRAVEATLRPDASGVLAQDSARQRIVLVAARGREVPVSVLAVLGILSVADTDVLPLPRLVVRALPYLLALVTPPSGSPMFVVDPDALFGDPS